MLGTWIHGALQHGTEATRQTAVEAAIVVGVEGETHLHSKYGELVTVRGRSQQL